MVRVYVSVCVCVCVVVVVVGGRTRGRVRMDAGSEYSDSLGESTLGAGSEYFRRRVRVCVCV